MKCCRGFLDWCGFYPCTKIFTDSLQLQEFWFLSYTRCLPSSLNSFSDRFCDCWCWPVHGCFHQWCGQRTRICVIHRTSANKTEWSEYDFSSQNLYFVKQEGDENNEYSQYKDIAGALDIEALFLTIYLRTGKLFILFIFIRTQMFEIIVLAHKKLDTVNGLKPGVSVVLLM